jgi:hypothetical protein
MAERFPSRVPRAWALKTARLREVERERRFLPETVVMCTRLSGLTPDLVGPKHSGSSNHAGASTVGSLTRWRRLVTTLIACLLRVPPGQERRRGRPRPIFSDFSCSIKAGSRGAVCWRHANRWSRVYVHLPRPLTVGTLVQLCTAGCAWR